MGPTAYGQSQPGTGNRPHGMDEQSDPIGEASMLDLAQMADLRHQAAQRLRKMNVLHARHAWEKRRSDPLSPYALAFLYKQVDPFRRDRQLLTASTKIWLAGPEVSNLPRLLFELNQTIAAQRPPYDVRFALANRRDDTMTDKAVYAGLGVSSLDTHTGTWEQVRSQVSRDSDVPGSIRVVMTDGSVMVGERRGLAEFNTFQVHSTHSLEVAPGHHLMQWSPVGLDNLISDEYHGQIVRWMNELSTTLAWADNQRIAAAQARGRRRAG
ncbi:hypothetical protein Cs7R123_61350 [Catellatospora sp. TT07R-123]|uniref:hypothetical protein n=1 Tax=Catellatospora sp. TT07R-123 TaxID=2733863 RepID=UPI001AFFC569|nr:hypothetical protein [Catellatospora sp. TT07R-123]GHJ48793.1 hypothetical protein Cs7R123_61350 [Catellatospora sp. TT07R-123]